MHPDAARHLNKLDLVFLTFRQSYQEKAMIPIAQRRNRLKEVGKGFAHGQSSHVLLDVADLKPGLLSEKPGLGRDRVGRDRAAGHQSPQTPK